MEKPRVIILGSGTCVPSLKRSSCSVLIMAAQGNILLDCGPGTLHQLLRAGLKITDIDAVLLSHFHPDHSSELAGFVFATKYPEFKRQKKLYLGGGPGFSAFFDRLNLAYENHLFLDQDQMTLLEFITLDDDSVKLAGLELTWSKVVHKPESRAYRLTSLDGYSVVYSGDTDFSEELIEFAMEADILICESALPDSKKVTGHLTPSLAGEIASEARVRTLVLTHFYPECDKVDIISQCRKSFSGNVIAATDLLEIY